MRIQLTTAVLLFSQIAVGQDASEAEIRAAISKSLPAIQNGGAAWMKEQDCLSCHQVSFMVWSLNRAVEHDFNVDADQLTEWNSWATSWEKLASPKTRSEAKKRDTLTTSNDTIAQLLLGRRNTKDETWVNEYTLALSDSQQKNGSWKAGGQLPLQKRSKRETQEVSTMWAVYALAQQQHPTASDSAEKALKWLDSETKVKSSEWWAARLLMQSALGNSELAEESRNQLVSLQHKDGGWGWLTGDPSDALGTAIVAYALKQHGVANDNAVIQKAARFLIRTQQDDGTWEVNGTKQSGRDSLTETASYWGTCWAVIAMTELL